MDPLQLKIQEEIENLITSIKTRVSPTFLLAVSGGRDSMVMAHSFLSMGLSFGIVHFNFQLRGKASDLDQDLVFKFCKENDIPFHCTAKDAGKIAMESKRSTQVIARELRYDYFDAIVKEYNYDYLCTAHHGNDQLETFFIHLFRGSGLKGMTGIPQLRDYIFRPMLWIPRDEIQRYVLQYHIPFREDESNATDKYLRNRIRHHIVQPISKSNPEYLTKSLDTIHRLTEYQRFIDHELTTFRKRFVKIKSSHIQMISTDKELVDHPNQLFLLKLYLLDQGLFPDSIENLISSCGHWQTGSMYEGHDLNGWYDRNKFWLIREEFYHGWDPEYSQELSTGSTIELPGGDLIEYTTELSKTTSSGSWIIPIDEDQVTFPLQIRHRKPGDSMEMGSVPYFRKSLKKLLNEYKIPSPFKDRIYLLTNKEDQIISIPGLVNSPKYTSSQNSEMKIVFRSALDFLFSKD